MVSQLEMIPLSPRQDIEWREITGAAAPSELQATPNADCIIKLAGYFSIIGINRQ